MIWVEVGFALQFLKKIFIFEHSNLEYAHDLKSTTKFENYLKKYRLLPIFYFFIYFFP